MSFWDSSAIVPLLVEQQYTARSQQLFESEKSSPIVWWGAMIESVSALCRLVRDELITSDEYDQAASSLRELSRTWHEIEPSAMLREKTIRALLLHPLRLADAAQLAAALIASEDLTTPLPFVCFDARLATAARKEGFSVVS